MKKYFYFKFFCNFVLSVSSNYLCPCHSVSMLHVLGTEQNVYRSNLYYKSSLNLLLNLSIVYRDIYNHVGLRGNLLIRYLYTWVSGLPPSY